MLNLCCRWSAEGSSEQWQKKSNLMKSDQWSTSFWKGELSSLDSAGDLHSSSSSSVIWPQTFFSLSSPTAPQDIIRATQHASPLHHLPFSILSFSSPHPSYLNPPATLLSSLTPSLLLPGAPCGSCHNRRWNGFICSNVVWAAAWHGTERHFIPVHWASLPLFLSLCAVHVFSNRPINTTQLWWPLFTSPSHNLCSQYVCKKATSHFSLSHTYTLLSLVANSQCHTAAIFFIFSSPLHFVVSFLHFFLYKPPCIFISLFFCLVSVYFVDSLLILSSANLYPSPFPSQQSQLLVISLPLGFIKLKPSTPSQPPASIKMWNDLSQGWKK